MNQAPSNKIRRSTGSKIFDIVNLLILVFLALITLYPFWDCMVVSVSSLKSYLSSPVHLWPTEFSFESYAFMLQKQQLWISYRNTLFVTVVGTAINMLVTVPAAYVLSKPYLRGHRMLNFMAVFTMMFSGGLIPTYMIVRTMGLMNSVWAMIIPGAITTYNLIILRNFFTSIPHELEESAMLDGCREIGVLVRIVLPVSVPALTTVTLFYAVAHWNEFFSAILYINNQESWPLQLFLRSMLFENDTASASGSEGLFLLSQPMKMATIMVAVIPIMCAYPFFQKYFTKGVMLGAVKG